MQMPINKNGRTIVLAEDDIEVCEYLETALKCEGYTVEVAQDSEEVLAFVQSSKAPISAILLDTGMLQLDGYETLKQVRRFDKNVPVVVVSRCFLTGYRDGSHEERGQSSHRQTNQS